MCDDVLLQPGFVSAFLVLAMALQHHDETSEEQGRACPELQWAVPEITPGHPAARIFS
jgi:hypothetical protein